MTSRLESASIPVEVFKWSASNTHRARITAGEQLAAFLNEQHRRFPARLQVVIAHSHGGNVALYAVRQLQRDTADARVRVITLATPFIHVRARAVPATMILGWLTIGALAVSSSIMSALVGVWQGSALALSIGSLVLAAVFLSTISPVLMSLWRSGWRFNIDKLPHVVEQVRDQWIRDVQPPEVERADVLVIRAAGDEATGILTLGHFMSWITTGATAVVKAWLVALAFAAAWLGCYVLVPDIEAASTLLLVVMFFLALLFGIPLFFGMALVMLASLAFGWDGPLPSFFAFLSTESTPPGHVEILQLPPFGADTKGRHGLAHSRLFNDPTVLEFISTNLERWAIEGAN
ncbi:esterase/lipase family protein [Geodermatophilus sp. SYSU D01186]